MQNIQHQSIRYTIDNLTSFTYYDIYVKAENSFGISNTIRITYSNPFYMYVYDLYIKIKYIYNTINIFYVF